MKKLTLAIVALLSIIISVSAQQPAERNTTFIPISERKPSYSLNSKSILYVCYDGVRWQKVGTTILEPKELRPTPLVKISPEPMTNSGDVIFTVPEAGAVEVTILTIAGSVVQPIGKGYYSAGEHSWQVQTDKLSSGVYLCMVKMGSKVTRRLFTIQK